MKKNPSQDLAVFVVWSSQLGAQAKHVAEAAELMPDPRAVHYWDGDQLVGEAYRGYLGTESAAWDVWMLFDREASWEAGTVPDPSWWEHQLRGLPRDKKLDPKRFAAKATELLEHGQSR